MDELLIGKSAVVAHNAGDSGRLIGGDTYAMRRPCHNLCEFYCFGNEGRKYLIKVNLVTAGPFRVTDT
jgi:hypothetical protein